MHESDGPIILYTSTYCGQSRLVENFLREHVPLLEIVNVDRDAEAHRRLIAINNGFASVPTVIFTDGKRLTEPPLSLLRQELGIEDTGLGERVRRILSGGS